MPDGAYVQSGEPFAVVHEATTIEAGYEFGVGLSLRAAITSVTDEDPPFVENESNANTDATAYPLLGRTYFVELRYAFR